MQQTKDYGDAGAYPNIAHHRMILASRILNPGVQRAEAAAADIVVDIVSAKTIHVVQQRPKTGIRPHNRCDNHCDQKMAARRVKQLRHFESFDLMTDRMGAICPAHPEQMAKHRDICDTDTAWAKYVQEHLVRPHKLSIVSGRSNFCPDASNGDRVENVDEEK